MQFTTLGISKRKKNPTNMPKPYKASLLSRSMAFGGIVPSIPQILRVKSCEPLASLRLWAVDNFPQWF